MAKLSPIGNNAQFINGIPANGAKLFTYAAGSSTKQTTYTDEAGTIPQTNPIILDSRGEPTQPIWLTEGLSYKFVFTASTDSDPPVSPIWDIDDVTGVNDASITADQWVDSGVTPTYVSATQFTLPGDQTSSFTVNRRIKALVTAGTAYGYISASVFGALTTITVVMDSTPLDSGLSSVQLGLLTPNNTSLFLIQNSNLADAYINDLTVATLASNDYVAIADTSDSNKKKKSLVSDIIALAFQQNYLTGYTLSTAGASATMSIASGQAADSTNAAYISLAAAISKTTAAWAVGTAQGGLDTGAIANATWYHFYAIRRPDTGVVDVVFSTNASTPTLPANYTQYRRIGSGLTNGSAQWVKFVQNGDTFLWDVPTIDADAVNPGTASVSRALTVPLGVVVEALLTVGGFNGTNQFTYAITPLSVADTTAQNPSTASLTGTPTDSAVSNGLSAWQFRKERCLTDTSRQVRTKLSVSGAADRLGIITRGWIDTRGK